jgi:hypothetical protein
MPSARRFPPPWSIEELAECFIVRDANRQALAYVYFEEEPGRRAAAHLLTRDEARRIAANIAKLPELLKQLTRLSKVRKMSVRRCRFTSEPFRARGEAQGACLSAGARWVFLLAFCASGPPFSLPWRWTSLRPDEPRSDFHLGRTQPRRMLAGATRPRPLHQATA